MRLNPFPPLARGLAALTDPLLDRLVDSGRRPARRWQLRLVLLVTVALYWIAFGTAQLTYDTRVAGTGPMFFVALVIALPFAFVLTRPMPALLFSVASAFVLALVLPQEQRAVWPWEVVQGLIVFVLLFATGVTRTVREGAVAWLLTSALFWWGLPPGERGGWAVGLGAILLIGVLTGRLLRTRQDLRRQTEVSEVERDRRIVLEERARLARDLHDIVAHHMSLVVVQAETAPYRVPEIGDAARDELLSISGTARSALAETRALLAVLRQENVEAEDAPQPGLHRLGELIETTRRAGVRLDVDISGDLDGLREGRSLAGFRIAQEALANAARHAPGTPVRLRARGDGRGVELTVVSLSGPGGAPAEPGHGIVGMRERAVAAGGRIEVGPTAEGFAVHLVLPADAEGQA
ncbi:sensor histidine kinase [Kineosporia sp. J2-2]|uniref:histidine kinase n=1 Tax=Kineosporia corallincola TaxID=2835133 RepID=A0ABS5TGH6_9ACTN|nr:histidine kinase [Kineosporia corallincola]MBT0769301.1 sensor histidine kinase [Kineosporia corallincola]